MTSSPMLRMKRLPPNSFRSEASGSPIGASAGLETSLCCCSTTSPRPLDDWDSLVTNGLACEREVIIRQRRLRLLHGGPIHELIDLDLKSPDFRSAVMAQHDFGTLNPGYVLAGRDRSRCRHGRGLPPHARESCPRSSPRPRREGIEAGVPLAARTEFRSSQTSFRP